MYSFCVDGERKILFIEFSEYIDSKEAVQASKEFENIINQDYTDYIIICDISNLKAGSRSARIALQKYMRQLGFINPKKIIRVVSHYKGAIFFDRAFNLSNANYSITKAFSKLQAIEIAEAYFDTPPVFREIPSEN